MALLGDFAAYAAAQEHDHPQSQRLLVGEGSDAASDQLQSEARSEVLRLMNPPFVSQRPVVTVLKQTTSQGLHFEELSWENEVGPPTEAVVVRPANSRDARLPAVLALHCHGAVKWFGKEKVLDLGARHPDIVDHQEQYYGGRSWVNELARRGFVVLVHDGWSFGSRRIQRSTVPKGARADTRAFEFNQGSKAAVDDDTATSENIAEYNRWAADYEHVIAKALFSGGTTWAGVMLAEDTRALDYLCDRPDVDPTRVGVGGLSGGGLRTMLLSSVDKRVAAAVDVGFMTTWRDMAHSQSINHTWFSFIPGLPPKLDLPELLALRAPAPTMVLNCDEDPLFTISEMHRADAIARATFTRFGGAQHYICRFFTGLHRFDCEMQDAAFDFFQSHLGTKDSTGTDAELVPLTAAEYAKLFNAQERVPAGRTVAGLCARFIRGTKPADFEVLSDEPGKRLSWVCSSEMLESILGLSPTEAMLSIGYRTPWLKARVEDGTTHRLVVFPQTADTTVVTWAGLWTLIARAYDPAVSLALEPFKKQIESLDTPTNGYDAFDPSGEINRLGTLPVAEKYAHPGYLTAERFLAAQSQTLYHARGFLDHSLGCNYRFTGTGHSPDGATEMMTVNRRLEDIDGLVSIELDVTLAAIEAAPQTQ